MIMVPLLLCILIFYIDIIECGSSKNKELEPSVCFIGVGQANLIWAQLLCDKIQNQYVKQSKKQYCPISLCDNIYMFETENDAALSYQFADIEDFPDRLQAGTMVLPYLSFKFYENGTVNTENVYKPMDDLMDRYDIPYEEWGTPQALIVPQGAVTPISQLILTQIVTNPQLFIVQLIKLLKICEVVNLYTTRIQDIYKLNNPLLPLKGEDWSTYALRVDITQVADTMAVFIDWGGALAPTQLQPAIFILKTIANYYLNMLAEPLRAAGITDDFGSPLIRALLDLDTISKRTGLFKRTVSVKNGIQRLWDAMVKELQFKGSNIYFNEKVINLNKYGGATKLTTINGINMKCDMTVISQRPIHLVEFLDENSFNEVYNLYNKLLTDHEVGWYNGQRFFEFGINIADKADVPSWISDDQPVAFAFDELLYEYGTFDRNIFYCKPSLFYTLNRGRTIVFGGYLNVNQFNATFTEHDCIQQIIDYVKDRENTIGIPAIYFEEESLIFSKSFIFPSVVPPSFEADGWYEELDELQGENGVYYRGEVTSGGWVLNVWDNQIATFDAFYTDYVDIKSEKYKKLVCHRHRTN